MALSSWHSYCQSSPGSFDKCRTAPDSFCTKPTVWIGSYTCSVYVHYRHLLLLTIWYSFTEGIEGWVVLGGWLITFHPPASIQVLTGHGVTLLPSLLPVFIPGLFTSTLWRRYGFGLLVSNTPFMCSFVKNSAGDNRLNLRSALSH